MKIAVIGGGAAGFFAAICAKENYPQSEVVIFEKSKDLLAKVKISGGGRCNLTNACVDSKELLEGYPRGVKLLKRAFHRFDNQATMRWFETRGVPLLVQDDNCVFPRSQNAQDIIDCFLSQAHNLRIQIERETGVKALIPLGEGLQLSFYGEKVPARSFAKVIVATGGSPRREGLAWLEKLGHQISAPVPSLFTFKMPDEPVAELMGIVVENTLVSIQATKFKAEGPLLITHWGMSGPAILKLSAYAARHLHDHNYQFKVLVNWTGQKNQDKVLTQLQRIAAEQPKKLLANGRPFLLPERLWDYLLKKSGLPTSKKWAELGKTGLNRLANQLSNDSYAVRGRTQFREEFVTCGGVSLESVDFNSLQSKVCDNLYFAGEVLDIDGITGGYNFQAAWTTAFIAAKLQ